MEHEIITTSKKLIKLINEFEKKHGMLNTIDLTNMITANIDDWSWRYDFSIDENGLIEVD